MFWISGGFSEFKIDNYLTEPYKVVMVDTIKEFAVKDQQIGTEDFSIQYFKELKGNKEKYVNSRLVDNIDGNQKLEKEYKIK